MTVFIHRFTYVFHERIGKASKSAARYDLDWTMAKPLPPSRKWKDIARLDLGRPFTARPIELATDVTARFDLGRSEVVTKRSSLSLSSSLNLLRPCIATLDSKDRIKQTIAARPDCSLQSIAKSKIMVRCKSCWISQGYG